MSEVLRADIFFFITGIAVIIFTFFLCIVLYHLIKILKAIRRIIDRVEAGTATLTDDIERLRTYVVEESFMSRFFRGASERSNDTETKARRAAPKKSKSELRIKNENN
jgi:hypothetical protein